MKKILSIAFCFMTAICGWSQSHDSTTDHISISTLQLTPGENTTTKYFVVSLVGTKLYTAVSMDIVLPEGYEYVLTSGGEAKINFTTERKQGLYPVTNPDEVEEEEAEPAYDSHTLSKNIIAARTLRVVDNSNENKLFAATSGNLFRVYVKATAFAKPGNADVQINNCFFNTEDGIQWDTKDITISDKLSSSTSSTLPLTINSSNHWSTCILPFAAAIPAGVKAYTVGSHDSENLLLSEANSFAAYTPYILYSEGGYSGNISGTVDPNQYPATGVVNTDGYLNGAIVAQNVTSGYVMQNLSEGVKFYQITSGTFNVPAGKCWMTLPTGGPVKGLGFVVEDESAIEQVKTPESHNIYNLAGQQVQNPQKGIYIVNGKKVMY